MNTALQTTPSQIVAPDWQQAVLVVGAGPTGFRFIETFRNKDTATPIILFGNEPYLPYDRVKLSSLLAGTDTPDSLALPLEDLLQQSNFRYICSEIQEIDSEQKQVIDAEGNHYNYRQLVLATGSRPHIPEIEGIDLNGVLSFRNMRDSERLKARTVRSQSMVVVGGGLLGIEAARALLQGQTKITLVQQASHLMNNQLDQQAAVRLQQELEQLGIEVLTGEGVRRIEGSDRVEAVVLRDNRRLACDTVLLSAGIKPNKEIARRAWLKVSRGIKVDDQLRTSDANIFAIGECAEHRGQVYGLVAPGLEQATIAADIIAGGNSRYLGSHSVAKLKVVDTPVFSMGDTDMDSGIRKKSLTYSDAGSYRKLVFSQGKLVGAMSIGEWNETPRIQELITHKRTLKPWQKLRFRFSGYIWNPDEAENPNLWPEQAIICNCNNVSRETLSQAIEQGCCSVAELSAQTKASTTCGSCKPLLQLMVGENQSATPEKGWSGLLATAIATPILAAMMLLIPGLSLSETVQSGQWLEQIWNDGLIKQITGFTLLGLTLIGLLMSLRKRIKRFQLGTFNHWRLLHVILGVLTLAILLAHTGLHTGSNLNQWLLYDYLALAALGALASVVIALQFKFSLSTGKQMRNFWFWSHLVLAWPLPVLLSFHILSVYYF